MVVQHGLSACLLHLNGIGILGLKGFRYFRGTSFGWKCDWTAFFRHPMYMRSVRWVLQHHRSLQNQSPYCHLWPPFSTQICPRYAGRFLLYWVCHSTLALFQFSMCSGSVHNFQTFSARALTFVSMVTLLFFVMSL